MEPRSLALVVEGVRSLSKRPVAVIVSLVASPRSTLPLAVRVVNAPEEGVVAPTVALSIVPALMSAVSATKLSMFAVPSMKRLFHSLDAEPRSCAASVAGTRSLSN